MENGGQSSTPSTKSRAASSSKAPTESLYLDKFEEYKAKRSLERHGCLPSSMRGDTEQQRKYSLDNFQPRSRTNSSSSSTSSVVTPPGVLPKPKRPASLDNRRDAFAKNRSLTSPALYSNSLGTITPLSPSSVFGNSTTYPPSQFSFSSNKSRTSSICSTVSNQDSILEEPVAVTGEKFILLWKNTSCLGDLIVCIENFVL